MEKEVLIQSFINHHNLEEGDVVIEKNDYHGLTLSVNNDVYHLYTERMLKKLVTNLVDDVNLGVSYIPIEIWASIAEALHINREFIAELEGFCNEEEKCVLQTSISITNQFVKEEIEEFRNSEFDSYKIGEYYKICHTEHADSFWKFIYREKPEGSYMVHKAIQLITSYYQREDVIKDLYNMIITDGDEVIKNKFGLQLLHIFDEEKNQLFYAFKKERVGNNIRKLF